MYQNHLQNIAKTHNLNVFCWWNISSRPMLAGPKDIFDNHSLCSLSTTKGPFIFKHTYAHNNLLYIHFR